MMKQNVIINRNEDCQEVSHFSKGDRIEMSSFAIREFMDGRSKSRTGIVIRVLKDGCLEVRRDSLKTVERWRPCFWKRA